MQRKFKKMSDFIFSAKQNHQSNKKNEDEFYTLIGNEESIDSKGNPVVSDSSQKIYAKKIFRSDNSYRFYVRLSNNGSLYNPVSVYGEEKYNTFLDRVVRDGVKFKEVNNKAFDMYLNFLRTKNIAWYYNTEREMV